MCQIVFPGACFSSYLVEEEEYTVTTTGQAYKEVDVVEKFIAKVIAIAFLPIVDIPAGMAERLFVLSQSEQSIAGMEKFPSLTHQKCLTSSCPLRRILLQPHLCTIQ